MSTHLSETGRRAWNKFFLEPRDPAPVCILRIFYALIVFVHLMFLKQDWFRLYGPQSIISAPTVESLQSGLPWRAAALIPLNDLLVSMLFWFLLCCSIMLCFGWWSRVSCLFIYVGLIALQQRNPFICSGGDMLLGLIGFYLSFAPIGSCFSIDHLLSFHHGKSGFQTELIAPWAQRLIQIQLTVVYVSTVVWKLRGHTWLGGSALAYVYQSRDFVRFVPPDAMRGEIAVSITTWATLLIEVACGTLIWIPRTRRSIVVLGVLFHVGIECIMNIPLFEWTMIALYLTFLDPKEIKGTLKRASDVIGGIC